MTRIGETRYLATRPDGSTMEFNSAVEAMNWEAGLDEDGEPDTTYTFLEI